MPFTVSFTDVNPPLRYDGQPWTQVQVQEAPALAGPWTTIDTQDLSPLDADPSQPSARQFTTAKATISEGFYQLVWLDANGVQSHPMVQVEDAPSNLKPSLSDLGSFMRARTVVAGTGGNELGTFSANTRPTNVEADTILNQAVDAVIMAVGADIPDRALLQARFMVVVYAAQLVELTFYRNEVNRDQSAYAQYQQLYNDGIEALKQFIADTGPAAAEPGMWSQPILNQQQAHWQNLFGAFDPATGKFDPTRLPPDEYFPYGMGGIPPSIFDAWPWLFGSAFGAEGGELAFLED